ncbi:His/Gly/Thr/Pro-type tRNA ligase C-terminal domain-containing protein [Microgenomates group bacterium]|nr:His/Gly/Thr/Pro-type tRNA ligase C-terminal domain-containing protein [Microgenomates group bacterium]
MLFSQLIFTPEKSAPANATTINHKLLTQAGFVRQVMAGVYVYTPLGLRVLRKISDIVRKEMEGMGSSEILMSALSPKSNWQVTGAWDSVDVLFKLNSQTNKEYALGFSHEEVVVPLLKEVISSYRDLPKSVYQIQWKFRDELRAKSGILRGREFLMKDMYSFHATHEDFEDYYGKAKEVYLKTFERLGLDAKVTEASGGSFSEKISYEFMVLTDAGEDDILYCPDCGYCVNTEIATQGLTEGSECPKCKKTKMVGAKASEAGNIFDLGTAKSAPFGLTYVDGKNAEREIYMGCYGIGISRAMGIIVEKHADDKGIVWPENVAPFQYHLIALGEDEAILKKASEVYEKLIGQGKEVLFDERRNLSAGAKFAAADLIGCPNRLVISPKTGIEQIELKKRGSNDSRLIEINRLSL